MHFNRTRIPCLTFNAILIYTAAIRASEKCVSVLSNRKQQPIKCPNWKWHLLIRFQRKKNTQFKWPILFNWQFIFFLFNSILNCCVCVSVTDVVNLLRLYGYLVSLGESIRCAWICSHLCDNFYVLFISRFFGAAYSDKFFIDTLPNDSTTTIEQPYPNAKQMALESQPALSARVCVFLVLF